MLPDINLKQAFGRVARNVWRAAKWGVFLGALGAATVPALMAPFQAATQNEYNIEQGKWWDSVEDNAAHNYFMEWRMFRGWMKYVGYCYVPEGAHPPLNENPPKNCRPS